MHRFLEKGGNKLGSFNHYDAEPDTFSVCDLHPNGAGVTGEIQELILAGSKYIWVTRKKWDDGGDVGCDYVEFNIREKGVYMWELRGSGEYINGDLKE
ncbi:hypothetical protein [Streptomyces afghaniensis]|uniref:hypothetical protein n=1 Tax=Streptomyces afghaniensis TaxID=66865 RepID=UPI002789EA18|nr:hypothetical protein [Streptomyces afghaniensis]MDQ1018932.1 hypothetical protein [Streptomyces afghaniensis]